MEIKVQSLCAKNMQNLLSNFTVSVDNLIKRKRCTFLHHRSQGNFCKVLEL